MRLQLRLLLLIRLISAAPLFPSSTVEAVALLREALPYDSVFCGKDGLTTADSIGCSERLLLVKVQEWLDWQLAFRKLGNEKKDCKRFCESVAGGPKAEVTFAYQGHKRFRKGYGNHVLASLYAILGAVMSNRSVVLGLDEETRELNTPHLSYDDDAVWTIRALRARYLSCGCDAVTRSEVEKERRKMIPLWRAQRDIAHLKGLGPADRYELATDPSKGLGLSRTLRGTLHLDEDFASDNAGKASYKLEAQGRKDCGSRGAHFLQTAWEEMLTWPNAYGLLGYIFMRPEPGLAAFVSDVVAKRPRIKLGVHVRVNLHVGTTTHGDGVLNITEKKSRKEPLRELWVKSLTAEQLPRLRAGGYYPADRLVLFSDQPAVAAALAKMAQAHGSIDATHFDAATADPTAMAAVTARENDGRFMIHSADWGSGPRWAALAEIFVLSTASEAVACSGPYSPSTFCELAGALAAVRRALDTAPVAAGMKPLFFLPAQGGDKKLRSNLVWCPPPKELRRAEPPPKCCEAVVLSSS